MDVGDELQRVLELSRWVALPLGDVCRAVAAAAGDLEAAAGALFERQERTSQEAASAALAAQLAAQPARSPSQQVRCRV